MTDDSADNLESQVQRLAHNGIALAAGGIAAQLAFTFLEILVARDLGAEAYGIFVTAYAWTVFVSYIIELGTPQWTIQEGSRRHNRLPELLGSGLTVTFALFVVLYPVFAIVSTALVPGPVLGFMAIILPYGLILAVQNGLGAVYSGLQTMRVNAFFQGLAPLVILAIYFLYSANGLTLADVGFAYIIGGAIVTGVWLVMSLWRVRPQVSVTNIRATLRSSYQYGLSGTLGYVYFKSDIILLSALAGLREAGIYAAASKLVELVFKVAVLSGRVFAPAIFRASHESGKTFQIIASMMTRFLAVAGLTAGVATFILADDLILLLFGDSYTASIPVLRILSGVMATRCMLVVLQLLLSSIDMHVQRVTGLGIAVVAHIAANALLIPGFGAVGAAWAALFSGTLVILLYAISSSRRRDFQILRWLLLPTSVAAAVAATAFFADVHAFIGAVGAVSAFLISLFAIGFVRPDEIRFVFRSVLSNGTE